MSPEDRELLRSLLTESRVLSLGVDVEGRPYVGLLPFVVAPDFSYLLVHASALARHSRGLGEGKPFSVLLHASDDGARDPLQLPRLTLDGRSEALTRDSTPWKEGRARYEARFPTSAPTFSLGDFSLYALRPETGRLVAGFARASTVTAAALASLA